MSVAVRQDPQLLEVNPPLVPGHPDYHDVTEQISTIVEGGVRVAGTSKTVMPWPK